MASEDVIELGSSDEETAEPAPKKRKPPPNAMVHIPGKLPPGLTVNPSKSAKTRINPASILKGAIGSAITVTKVSKNVNPFANPKKLNANTAKGPLGSKPGAASKRIFPAQVPRSPIVTGMKILNTNTNSVGINPVINLPQKPNRSVPNSMGLNLVKLMKPQVQGNVKIPVQLKKSPLNNAKLPAGLTIKRTTAPSATTSSNLSKNKKVVNQPYKLVHIANSGAVVQVKSKGALFHGTRNTNELPTVNLDDDEPTTSSGPQWYLRPEDLNKEEIETGQDQDPFVEQPNDPETDKPSDNNIDKTTDTGQEKSVEKSHMSPAEKSQKSLTEKSQKSPAEKSPPATNPTVLEKENNEEPDKNNFIEITIEDSPIKFNKKGFEVGAELAITIEDSPVRNKSSKRAAPSSSDDDETASSKERHSRKKLEYPKTVKAVQVVEIEFEPFEPEATESSEKNESEVESTKISAGTEQQDAPATEAVRSKKSPAAVKESSSNEKEVPSTSENKKEKPKSVVKCFDIVEIEDSPIKAIEEVKITTPKKSKTPPKPAFSMTQPIEIIDLDDKEKDEFSPVYLSFIKLCFQLENSDDMKKIVEKKIKAYYRQVPKEYTESDTFTDMVSSKVMAMKASPEKMYLYIKDIVDELNLQRKMVKTQPAKEKEEQRKFLYGEDSEFDAKRQRQIRKLEKTLKKLHRAIQKLEEQEVDFDDEEDSVYLLTESEDDTSAKESRPQSKEVLLQRYKERSVRVHAKLCQLTNTKMPSEARVQIDPRPGQPKGPAKRLEKWINRKVPIGTALPFPDFHDVLRCVREANEEDKIGWNEADVMEEARDLFVRCGKKLQRRRQENEWRLAASRVPADALDPAEDSADLKRKLEENKRLAAKKETEVFNKYADRQNQLKLEAVEIGDKEAEESPVESDDEVEEEVVKDTDSLTDKQKRKERIKRLLQKSKVSEEGKDKEKLDDLPVAGDKSDKNVTKDSNESKPSPKTNKDDDKKDNQESEVSDNTSNKENKNAVESDSGSKSRDEVNEVESDIDEHHLLKRRSAMPNNSSSDTGSAIAIDDTSSSGEKSSDERDATKLSGDVISIENSSYSESEEKKDDLSDDTEKESVQVDNTVVEIDCSQDSVENIFEKMDDDNKCLEDRLLASSDDADNLETRKGNPTRGTCFNLKDDNISIGETIIVENREIDGSSEESKADNSDKNTITDGSSVEGMDISPIHNTNQNTFESIAERACEESPEQEIGLRTESTKLPAENEVISAAKIVNVKTKEAIKQTNKDIIIVQSVKSPETNEVKSSTKTTNGESNETIEDNSASPESVAEIINLNSVESIDDETCNETNIDIVKNLTDDNLKETILKPIETTTQDKVIVNDKNTSMKEIEGVSENINNGNEDISLMKKVIDVINTIENCNKHTHIKKIEECLNNSKEIHKETDIGKDVPLKDMINTTESSDIGCEDVYMKEIKEFIKDSAEKTEDIDKGSVDTSLKEIANDVNTTDKIYKSNENKIEATKENNNSVSEAMEVDSLDETL